VTTFAQLAAAVLLILVLAPEAYAAFGVLFNLGLGAAATVAWLRERRRPATRNLGPAASGPAG
jgi:hypothetical protein